MTPGIEGMEQVPIRLVLFLLICLDSCTSTSCSRQVLIIVQISWGTCCWSCWIMRSLFFCACLFNQTRFLILCWYSSNDSTHCRSKLRWPHLAFQFSLAHLAIPKGCEFIVLLWMLSVTICPRYSSTKNTLFAAIIRYVILNDSCRSQSQVEIIPPPPKLHMRFSCQPQHQPRHKSLWIKNLFSFVVGCS